MRIRHILLGSIAAFCVIAGIATAVTPANAASTDANGVVTISKSEVKGQFPGMNDKAFQAIVGASGESLTGSNVFTATTTTGVGCSDGTVQEHFRSTIITSPIAVTENYNANPDKINSWTLGAKGASVITESNTYGTSPSGRFPNYATICEGHGYVTSYFASLNQSHSDVTTYQFDGKPVSIVVNPYVAPAPVA